MNSFIADLWHVIFFFPPGRLVLICGKSFYCPYLFTYTPSPIYTLIYHYMVQHLYQRLLHMLLVHNDFSELSLSLLGKYIVTQLAIKMKYLI